MKNLLIALFLTIGTLTVNYGMAQTKPELEIKASAEHQLTRLNINNATLDELVAVPGLGKVKAQAILDYIQQHGTINNEQQLTQVKGIGDKLAARISQYVAFE
ncbi:helix-hairpin-helix domain-containing protein [Chromatiaceae bacterium AAb-1]|nr:helix-hairpin-helix domain-containing protein [Chromatiaceae bacterium AAb-1]